MHHPWVLGHLPTFVGGVGEVTAGLATQGALFSDEKTRGSLSGERGIYDLP